MVTTDWIAYVGPFRFPEGEAASSRIKHTAHALAAAGYHLIIAGGEPEPVTPLPLLGQNPAEQQITYVGTGELLPTGKSQVRKLFRILCTFGARTIRWLDAQPSRPQAIILYGGYSPYLLRLLPWCRRHGIPLIADIVEWHHPRHLPGGKFGPFPLNNELALRWLYPCCNGVIGISAYLEKHFQAKGLPVLRVPPVLDPQDSHWESQSVCVAKVRQPLRLLFSGSPDRDRLDIMLEGIIRLRAQGQDVVLEFMGSTREQIARLLRAKRGLLDSTGEGVHFHGRLPQEQVSATIARAHVAILVRESARWSNACFPSKVPEFLLMGVPLLSTRTSDLESYIRDGVEGVYMQDVSVEAFMHAVKRIIDLTDAQWEGMRAAAIACGRAHFDYRQYSVPLAAFIDDVCARSALRSPSRPGRENA